MSPLVNPKLQIKKSEKYCLSYITRENYSWKCVQKKTRSLPFEIKVVFFSFMAKIFLTKKLGPLLSFSKKILLFFCNTSIFDRFGPILIHWMRFCPVSILILSFFCKLFWSFKKMKKETCNASSLGNVKYRIPLGFPKAFCTFFKNCKSH